MSDIVPTDADVLDLLRLNRVRGVGPRIQKLLFERFGTARRVLEASVGDLQSVPGVGTKLAQAVANARNGDDAVRELDRCREQGITLLTQSMPEYPRMLMEIPDPPNLLFCRGNVDARDELAIGIVGSRRCTLYGKQQAERFASALARAGMTVVSGLARGIDGAAHRGALEAGGRTIAVLANGLETIYPPEHAPLADDVSRNGVVMTEAPLDSGPMPGMFPQRNRIISGLSLGVIVIEAARNSGALHTARHAMEQGRDVFALPGRVDSLASEGCHALIRDGATLIRNVDDIFESLGPLCSPVPSSDETQVLSPRELTLSQLERDILNLVGMEQTHIDEVLRTSPLESGRVLATLTVLEMKRMVRRLPGGYLIRSAQ